MIRRGCTLNCLGCLIPAVAVVALVLLAVRLWTTPPNYPAVTPSNPAALQLSEAQAVATALSDGQPIALLHLSDAEATGLLRESVGSYRGLSNLQIHVMKDRVVVSGQTTILKHPLVISGPVSFKGQGKGTIGLEFSGLAIGQMSLPSLIPQLLAREFHPTFELALVSSGRALTFACDAARPNDLIVGVSFGQGTATVGVNPCQASK
jgi:hypothetical protein